jgi:hypothetical protein
MRDHLQVVKSSIQTDLSTHKKMLLAYVTKKLKSTFGFWYGFRVQVALSNLFFHLLSQPSYLLRFHVVAPISFRLS